MLKKFVRSIEKIVAWGQSKLSAKQFIFLSSVLVGISAAWAVIILKAFAHWVFSFANSINEILKLSFINSILPIVGILLTVLVIKKVLGGTLEKGTSQILFAVAKKGSVIPRKQMYSQIVTSSLTVGLGGSAGLESPIVITGAAFGSNYAQRYNLSYNDRTLLIGCGVAAGIAAAFNAPIAGVLFAIEVLLVDVSIAAFTPIMIAAATGALVSTLVLDESVLLNFSHAQTFAVRNIPFYAGLGIFTGFLSVFYAKNFQRLEVIFARLNWKIYNKALVGATLLGLLIFVFPVLFGEGYESIRVLAGTDPGSLLENTLFSDFRHNKLALLLFIGLALFLKVFATGITFGSGGNGGNFAPSLFMGSYAGFVFAKLFNWLGMSKLPVENFVLVGMSGILSGLFHAPLTAIFLIAEITGGYSLMVPLMIVSSISFAISKKFEKHSLDVKKLAKSGNVFTSNKDTNILASLHTESLIQADELTLSPEENLERLVSMISNSNQELFAVLNPEKQLIGLVNFNDIREIVFSNFKVKYTHIHEIMRAPEEFVNHSDSMELVMRKFEKTTQVFLPVLKQGQYFGFISKSAALEAYREQLKSMVIE